MRRLGTIVTALLVTIYCYTGAVAHAATFNGVGLAPGPAISSRGPGGFHYHLEAGQSVTDSIKILNTSTQLKQIRLTAVPAVITADNRFICPATQSTPAGEVHFSKSSVSLLGDAVVLVPFTLTAPSHSQGEYNICLIGEETTQNQSGSIPLTSRLAMRLSIITGKTPAIAVTLSPPAVRVNRKSITYSTRLTSTTSASLSVNDTSSLRGAFIQQHYAGPKRLVLPSSYTSLSHSYKRPLWGGWYKLKITASAQSANNSWTHDTTTTLVETTKTVFVWPQPWLLCVVGTTVFAAVYLIYIKSRRKRDK